MRREKARPSPARAVAPGVIVRRELDERGWTQDDLAKIMDRPVQAISEIVSGKKQITPETALGLAAAFGTSAEMWLELEAAFRLRLARESGATSDVERRGRIYGMVPVKELVRRGWIADSVDVDELERQIETFLKAETLDRIPPLRLAARRTVSREPDPRGVLAWTRRVEQLAAAQKVGAYDPAGLSAVVDGLLELTSLEDGPLEAGAVLRGAGVHFVIVPHLPKTYFDGALLWVDGNPVVALTLRYDRLDSFWFTLMHEVAHLACGHEGSRLEDLDGDAGGDPDEAEADRKAAEWLVPGKPIADLVAAVSPYFSRQAIWSFAESVGRHPAIVIGRLQHDGHVSQAHLRGSIPGVRRMLEPFTDVAEPVAFAERRAGATAVAEVSPPYDPEGAVLELLRRSRGWTRPAEVKSALGLDRSSWSKVIGALLEAGKVERKGRRRGTFYRAAEEG
ncbi:MAG TPA: HigA family addiction module antitoxin [Candidatus Sulfomarinibacteraceae bacterium]|nr:HigA family addiction module antitoxin [Candidatus Sulfomarinibacteraceae bacterium]